MMLKCLRRQIQEVLAAAVIFGICFVGEAQWVPRPGRPFVSVQAADPLASEPGDNPGTFTISREGDTNAALTVPFSLGGTASNGVDYAAIPTNITLAAGQLSSNLAVTPISEPASSGYKTVILKLPHTGFGRGADAPDFMVGSLDRALIYIVYNYTNLLYRRLLVGLPQRIPTPSGSEIRDTADWKSALQKVKCAQRRLPAPTSKDYSPGLRCKILTRESVSNVLVEAAGPQTYSVRSGKSHTIPAIS